MGEKKRKEIWFAFTDKDKIYIEKIVPLKKKDDGKIKAKSEMIAFTITGNRVVDGHKTKEGVYLLLEEEALQKGVTMCEETQYFPSSDPLQALERLENMLEAKIYVAQEKIKLIEKIKNMLMIGEWDYVWKTYVENKRDF